MRGDDHRVVITAAGRDFDYVRHNLAHSRRRGRQTVRRTVDIDRPDTSHARLSGVIDLDFDADERLCAEEVLAVGRFEGGHAPGHVRKRSSQVVE
ncbi:hypothetical protein [Streptomyces violaceusniger]|uniref:Uncharacterized protein n=1 Tax=Streptomyces violaceusniger (strain Tu 4113) TaxID=653045 RepID=G2PF72_STRV4|nr:hypothetical protein [Streptomyces violaceusniger]AEM84215.1 hypothetical protein Strvi_4624 [Streptomyces violaceusniger Tu 4113]